jgi:hypothetical protein
MTTDQCDHALLPVHVCPDTLPPLRGPGAAGVNSQCRRHSTASSSYLLTVF